MFETKDVFKLESSISVNMHVQELNTPAATHISQCKVNYQIPYSTSLCCTFPLCLKQGIL